MATFAQIVENVVVKLSVVSASLDDAPAFLKNLYQDPDAVWVECGDIYPAIGWVLIDDRFLPPFDAAKEADLKQIATTRWIKTQFLPYDGVTAYADPAVPALTAKIRVLDEAADDTTAVNFKIAATTWRSWTLTDLKAYGTAIDAHIQAAFDREAALAGDIASAADLDALNAIDLTAGWPG